MEEGKPLPVGEDYHKGEMYNQYNVRQYALWRDNYTCQCCGEKPTDKKSIKLHVRHLESRKIGSEAPGNKITLCEACHEAYHKGLIQLPEKRRKRSKSYRDAAFMGIMRKSLLTQLRGMLTIPVKETYGFVTKYTREKYGIKKTHTSDAQCIANAPLTKPAKEKYLIIPVRRHNRQIYKASILKGGFRKKNQAPKYVFGFRLFDLVQLPSGECGFIFGRRSSGSFDVRHLGGKKISAGISCKKLRMIEHPSNLLTEKIA